MSSSVDIGLRTAKSADNPVGYQHVDTVPAKEVCVIYLGGDGTTTDKAANGYAKIIENEILNQVDAKVPVYSVTYNFGEHKKSTARHLAFMKHRQEFFMNQEKMEKMTSSASPEEINPQYVDDLFNKLLLPRISVMKGKGRLSTDEACRRIRKMTLVAHCHGGYVALKLEEKMQRKMEELGYSAAERKRIQAQMLVVAHAPACPLGISKSQFVSFQSVYDLDAPQGHNVFNEYLVRRRREEMKRFNAEDMQNAAEMQNNRWFDFKPCYFAGKQGNLFLVKQKYEWDDAEGPFLINQDEHNNVHYNDVNQTKGGKFLAYFSKNILINSIKNSLCQDENFTPLPPLEKLILSDNPEMNIKEKSEFERMSENGKAFRKEVCDFAIKKVRGKQQESK